MKKLKRLKESSRVGGKQMTQLGKILLEKNNLHDVSVCCSSVLKQIKQYSMKLCIKESRG